MISKKNLEHTLKIPDVIKKTTMVFMASGLFFACNDGNKKAEEEAIEIDPLEVEQDTISNYSYDDSGEVTDFLIYVNSEGEYAQMQEEMNPKIALQKFAAAIENRRETYGLEVNENLEAIEDTVNVPLSEMNGELETVVTAFEELQENFYVELSDEVGELKAEFQEIDLRANDAEEKLRSFFMNAANIMENMDAPNSDEMLGINPGAVDKSDYSQKPDTLKVAE